MNAAWALRLDACAGARVVARLGPLRLSAGLEACVDVDGDGATWLRGAAPLERDPALERLVRATGGARFEVDPGGELRAPGRRLPSGRLPGGPWAPLAAFLRPTPQAARAAGLPAARVALALRRAPEPAREPELLRGDRTAFVRWALAAPQVRLARLEVAARADRPEVLVRGAPPPPLPGERFVVQDGVAVLAGWAAWPALDASTLRGALGLDDGALGLLVPAGDGAQAVTPATLERVDARWFAPASRALARALEATP